MRQAASGFRPDIEGLRALAIVFVVAAHAGLLGLVGGFTGVDVFFVLSGYLITGQLIEEQRRTGQIDLLRFYARRLRRLLPAALLVLGVSLILVWQFLPASTWRGQAQAAAASAAWISNMHFTYAQLDYFGSAAAENLFLHTWSLSVEEQFYLFWPLLLLGAVAVSPHHRERQWRIALWLVMGFSLAFCLWPEQENPLSAFYLMPSRAWQFALGGLGWLYGRALAKGDSCALPMLGLILLAISGWGLHEALRYPGYWAVLPSLGSLLLLIAGATRPGNRINQALGLPALQWLGQRSYALYLWHWPILLVGRDQLGLDSTAAQSGLMLLALGLAALTHTAVETPLRQWSLPLRKPRHTVWIGLGLAGACAAGIFFHFPTERDTANNGIARPTIPLIYAQGCDDWYRSAELKVCAYGDPNGPRTVIAVGDSIGLQWFPALHSAFAKKGWKLLVMTKSSCPMVDEPVTEAAIKREFTECAQWRRSALQAIAEIAPDLVVWGSSDSYALSAAQWTEGSARALAATGKAGRIVILRSTPKLPAKAMACSEPRGVLHAALSFKNLCTSPAEAPQGQAVFQALQTAAARFDNVSVVDLNGLVCPDGECTAVRDGQRVFRDQQHLNGDFVLTLSAAVSAVLLNPQ